MNQSPVCPCDGSVARLSSAVEAASEVVYPLPTADGGRAMTARNQPSVKSTQADD